ncbi:hypothetical protein GGR44_003040 [Sphingobium fontiphilum]|uniref:ATP-dependent RNA helicase n=1 Tax=Sphingobium fontiphilum TaxID=944425 RepID=A0A7W6DMD8_9SPHN|nr:RcnB family protein [Sphingobium fontiphilum]MBB3983352.1 hypothetical protein [Sphingobium fontiphilum]
MFRKWMLAGLMTATILGGVAPAYAQRGEDRRGDGRRSEGRVEQTRPQGNHNMRGNWNQAQQRPAPQRQTPVQPQVRAQAQVRAQDDQRRWQARPAPQQRVTPPQQGDNRVWDRGERAREHRQDWRQEKRDDRREGRGDRREDRQDWRQDRRDDRRDWREDRRDDRRDWRQDRRDEWRNDQRRDEWRRDQARRYSDRDRWNSQRRWDNRWRAERRYDWNSYRTQYRERYRLGRYYAPRGWDYGYRRFSIGFFLSNMLYSNNYWINDPYYYRLPPAYGTLRWVRYYDDALLVDIRDGYVVDVIHNFFW